MHKRLPTVTGAVTALFLAMPLSGPAFSAGHTNDPSTVVATVNGTEITVGHMAAAKATLPEQYRSLPDDVLFDGILEQLIQQTVLADSVTDMPLRAQMELANQRRNTLATVAVETLISAPITDADLQAAYDAEFAGVEPEPEFNASHILVETQEEAAQISELAKGGADFAELAKERSTGPSGPNGGQLGWFGKGQMVPPFEAAVLEMAAGDISEPVETQFGWHVIRMNETRVKDAPAFDTVKDRLRSDIQAKALEALVNGLVEAAEVSKPEQGAFDPSFLSNPDLFSE